MSNNSKKTAILVDPVVGNIIKRLAVMHNIKMGEVIENFCMPMFEDMLLQEAKNVVSTGRVGRKPKIEMTVPASAPVPAPAPAPASTPAPTIKVEREPGSYDELDPREWEEDGADEDKDEDEDEDEDSVTPEEEAELRELINSSRVPF